MTTSYTKLIAIFTCAALVAATSVLNAQQQGRPSGQIQVQVQPQVQPLPQPGPYMPLGIMSQLIGLQQPIQIGGGGSPIQPAGGGSIQPAFNQVNQVNPNGGMVWVYNGFMVHSVNHGSVACRAGLESGDIILMLNGFQMTDQQSLNRAVAASQNQRVACQVRDVRTGQPTTVWCDFSGNSVIQPANPIGGIQPANQIPQINFRNR